MSQSGVYYVVREIVRVLFWGAVATVCLAALPVVLILNFQ